MSEEFTGQVDVLDDDTNLTIRLNANRASLYIGGNGSRGSLRLKDAEGAERVVLDADGQLQLRNEANVEIVEITANGTLLLRDSDERVVLRFVSGRGILDVGAEGSAGQISVHDESGADAIHLDGSSKTLNVTDDNGEDVLRFEGNSATLRVGAEGNGGDFKILNDEGGLLFHVTAQQARLRGAMMVGASNAPGQIGVFGPMGRPAIHADGNTAKLQLGNLGNAGDFVILDSEPNEVLKFSGLTGTLSVGGEGKPGYVVLRNRDGAEVGRLSGNEAGLFLGREGRAGEVLILNNSGKSSFAVDGNNGIVSVGTGDNRVVIDGSVGDIKLMGADCAEEFALADTGKVDPGTVMVIESDSALASCSRPYDRRVAGVVSGAGGVRPGILLNQGEDSTHTLPVALNGKVFCKVDANRAPVEIGDLLTTSATRGHAMKADDAEKAHGAVLGKALGSMDEGTGLIPVLVSLL